MDEKRWKYTQHFFYLNAEKSQLLVAKLVTNWSDFR